MRIGKPVLLILIGSGVLVAVGAFLVLRGPRYSRTELATLRTRWVEVADRHRPEDAVAADRKRLERVLAAAVAAKPDLRAARKLMHDDQELPPASAAIEAAVVALTSWHRGTDDPEVVRAAAANPTRALLPLAQVVFAMSPTEDDPERSEAWLHAAWVLRRTGPLLDGVVGSHIARTWASAAAERGWVLTEALARWRPEAAEIAPILGRELLSVIAGLSTAAPPNDAAKHWLRIAPLQEGYLRWLAQLAAAADDVDRIVALPPARFENRGLLPDPIIQAAERTFTPYVARMRVTIEDFDALAE